MKKTKIPALLLAFVIAFVSLQFSVSAETSDSIGSLFPDTEGEEVTYDFSPSMKNGKIYGFPEKSVAADVRNIFHNSDVAVYDNYGNKIEDGSDVYLATGFVVTINQVAYGVVVMGDADGDGRISTNDFFTVKRAYLGTLEIEEVFKEAVGIREGGELRASCYIRVKRAYYGTFNINYEYACEPYTLKVNDNTFTEGWV